MFICSESLEKKEGVVFSCFRFVSRFFFMQTRIQLVFQEATSIILSVS